MRKWNYCSSLVLLLCLSFSIELEAADISDAKNLSVESVTQARDVVLKGKVTDKEGNELPGASILVDGTTVGTVTDINGEYSLRFVPKPNQKLIFSFVGLRTQAIPYANQKTLNVVLEPGDVSLDDVVVIGYGSKNRKSLTSSIASIDKKNLETLSTTSTSLDNLLGGTIKGVLSVQASGEPGAMASINIRGITSPYPRMDSTVDSNAPLYVVDGVPTFLQRGALNPLLALSPNDIESIDVLKDAAATAIYGSRGANGVIIVKTKNGHKGEKVSIDAGYTFSVGNPIKKFKRLSANEFKQHTDLILRNTVNAVNNKEAIDDSALYAFGNIDYDESGMLVYNGLSDSEFGTADTDWYNEIQNKNAGTHQYNLAVRGGSERTNYSFSFNGMNQEGLYINDDFSRYSGRMSIDTEVNKFISIGGSMNYSRSDRKNSTGSMDMAMDIAAPWIVRPDVPVYDADGNYSRIDMSALNFGMPITSPNPVAQYQKRTKYKSEQFLGSAYVDLKLFKGFKLHADFNLATTNNENRYFTPLIAVDDYSSWGMPYESSLTEGSGNYTDTSINFRADYSLTKNKNNFTAMFGYGADRSFYNFKSVTYKDFPNDAIMDNVSSATYVDSKSDGYNRGGLNSIYSRLTYSFDDRYLIEGSLRADASSKFGPGNRWGVFPALSLGWRVNNEKFLKNIDQVDDLKLRLSLGRTGSTNVADFSYKQFFTREYSDLYGGNLGIVLKDNLPNRDIRWEMTTEFNFGVDFSFFSGRLFGSIDTYYRYTDGALAPSPHILEAGLSEYYANLIDMSNRGVEVQIGGDIIRTHNFTWNSVFTIAANRNKVENLNGAIISPYMEDFFTVGSPAGVLRGYKVMNIVQNQSEIDKLNEIAVSKGYKYYQSDTGVGDYLMEDTNGDGTITSDDRTVIATPQPKCFGGWSNNFTYKGFTLSFLFQYSCGAEAIWSPLQSDAVGSLGQSANREIFENTWTPENINARYARLVNSAKNTYNYSYVDRFVFKTSYLRMKNITLAYNLPSQWLQKMYVNNASVFVTATNLFTITKWPGLDPELTSIGTTLMASAKDPYPQSKTFSVGLKLQF